MPKHIPIRHCIACREGKPKAELIRVVCSPGGEISIDKSGKSAGRGAYICPTEACMQKAKKSRALERNLKKQITPEIYNMLSPDG